MDSHAVESIELEVPAHKVHAYVADPLNLPEWTLAFRHVGKGTARMVTPRGDIEVQLGVDASVEAGTIDWTMSFPDGAAAKAFSRVVPLGSTRSVFTFILPAPPVPLEELEGTLAEQRSALRDELQKLRARLVR